MQIMQIFQSKYDFVTSKRFNNKIKEYEKLGFVITNSVIDDCNLAYSWQLVSFFVMFGVVVTSF